MAVALTQEQFEQLLSRLGGPRATTTETETRRRRITSKEVQAQTFDGHASAWSNSSFGFKVAIKSVSSVAHGLMVEAERMVGDAKDDVLEVDCDDAPEISGEIYSILCQYVSGEAMTILRGTPDCQGLLAWQRLHKKYNPKTMARAIRLMSEVTNPGPIKHIKDVESALTAWEGKRRQLEEEFDESVSNGMQIAIMTSMMAGMSEEL